MRKCEKCGKYTLKTSCPDCGAESLSPHPAGFSPEDKYWKQRLVARGVLEC